MESDAETSDSETESDAETSDTENIPVGRDSGACYAPACNGSYI